MRASLHHNNLQPLAMLDQVPDAEPALAFRRAQVARSQNPAEPTVSCAVLRIDQRVRGAVDEYEPRAGNDPRARHRLSVLARKCVRAHDASERVMVGDPEPCEPKLGGARDHLLGMRGSAQKRKIRHRRQFGEPRFRPDQGAPLLVYETDKLLCSKSENKDRTILGENTSVKAWPEIPVA